MLDGLDYDLEYFESSYWLKKCLALIINGMLSIYTQKFE